MNFILTPCICVSHVTVTVTWFDLFVLDMKTETACEGKAHNTTTNSLKLITYLNSCDYWLSNDTRVYSISIACIHTDTSSST
jgi:hypothetical protein